MRNLTWGSEELLLENETISAKKIHIKPSHYVQETAEFNGTRSVYVVDGSVTMAIESNSFQCGSFVTIPIKKNDKLILSSCKEKTACVFLVDFFS